MGDYAVTRISAREDSDYLIHGPEGQLYAIELKTRERITPQIADGFFQQLKLRLRGSNSLLVVYVPVISPRVAQIAKQHEVSWMDQAGNCRIVDPRRGLLIYRTGLKADRPTSGVDSYADPFAPKSSRIVRLMLSEPRKGWQVSELAEHPDVEVSAGLVSKVKQSLLHENYAHVRDRLLYLKQPRELLSAWVKEYSGPAEEWTFYMRGDTETVEHRISEWCEDYKIDYALARFSAAWRQAPEVRYSTASVYVGPKAFTDRGLEAMRVEAGAKQVESGANLLLLVPFDRSVFINHGGQAERTTSPLQTYLDLKSMGGRGEEAAESVYEKYLGKLLHTTVDEGEMNR